MKRIITGLALLACATFGAVAQIDANLCDSKATAETKELYRYLREDVWGKKVISAAQALWDYNTTEADKIKGYCGKTPKMNIFDFQHHYESHVNYRSDLAKNWWQGGGIVGFIWHWHIPMTPFSRELGDRGFYTDRDYERTYFRPTNAVVEGSLENKVLHADLDEIVEYMLHYQSQGIPVVWRPFHEAAGNEWGVKWFWWGIDGRDAFIALWNYVQDYMWERGVHNCIYVWTSQLIDRDWYPGDDRVDIIARDNYAEEWHGPKKDDFNQLRRDYPNKMLALAECGYVPNPDEMRNNNALWLFVAPWCSDEYVPGKNDASFWQTFMGSDLIVTK